MHLCINVHASILQIATSQNDATYIEKKEEVELTGNYAQKMSDIDAQVHLCTSDIDAQVHLCTSDNHIRVYFANYFYITGWNFDPICDYHIVKYQEQEKDVEMQTIDEVMQQLIATPLASPRS